MVGELMGKQGLGLNSPARLPRIITGTTSTKEEKTVYRRSTTSGAGGGGDGDVGVAGVFSSILEKLRLSTRGAGKGKGKEKGKGKGKEKWKGKEREEPPQQEEEDYTEHHHHQQQPQQHQNDSTFSSKSQQRQGNMPTLAAPTTSVNYAPQPGPSTSASTHPPEEWHAILSPEQSRVLRK